MRSSYRWTAGCETCGWRLYGQASSRELARQKARQAVLRHQADKHERVGLREVER